MKAYTVFADIYDEFMENIPYDEWGGNIHGILLSHGIKNGIIAELGCGTGRMTRLMAGMGYEMIGIDSSGDMLAVAGEEEDEEILYLMQDMRELELYGTVSAVISVCDSMNYLIEDGDLINVLRKVNLYLERDGIFIFDMKTLYCYENILGDSVQYEDAGDCAIVWENHFDREKSIHTYDLTMFIAYGGEESEDDEYAVNADNEGGGSGAGCSGRYTYEKYRETHTQRVYSIEEVKNAIKEAGMELVSVNDADTGKEPCDTTQRLYFVAKESFQENKLYL